MYGDAVLLPCSGRSLDVLGKSLAGGQPSDDDRMLFTQVVGAYQVVLDHVEQRLAALGLEATTRWISL